MEICILVMGDQWIITAKLRIHWYYAGAQSSFTADFKTKNLKNETAYKISFDVRYPDRIEKAEKERIEKTNLEVAPSDETWLVSGLILNPYDKFELFFS